MPLYSDSSYYCGGAQLYSPYYVPSSSFAPSFSGYSRNALSGTYSAPPARSTFAAINRHYKPMLTPISESYAARRPQNLASLTRINSPKLNLHSSYIPPRPIQINTADIDVSSSRYRRAAARSKSPEKIVYGKASSPANENDSPFMPRVDQNDPPQNRSTIKRDRNIVRLSTMRSRSKSRSKKSQSSSSKSSVKKDSDTEATTSTVPHSPSPDTKGKTSWRDKFGDDLLTKNKDVVRKTPGELILEKHIIKPKHKEPEEGQMQKTEIIYLEPKLRKSIRRHSLAKCPSFKDICKDISAELKVNDDLNAGELRRRASLIFEEEQQNILQKIVESGAESVDEALVAVDEQINEPILEEADDINLKLKHSRHIVTAIVDVDNMEERAETKDVPIEQNKSPKWKVVVEKIEEDHAIHTVFKLPKKKAKTSTDGAPKVAKPKPISKIKKSESGEDFWGAIGTRETVYYDQRRRDLLALEMKKKEDDLLGLQNAENLQEPKIGCEDETVETEVTIKKSEDIKPKVEKTEPLPLKKSKSKPKANVGAPVEKNNAADAGKATEKVEQGSVSVEKAKVKTVDKVSVETKIKIGQKQKIVVKSIETAMHPKLTENKQPKIQNATVTIIEKQSIITKRFESAQKLTILPSKSPDVATSSQSTITPTSTDASQITTDKYDANMNNKNVVKIQPSKNSEIQTPLKITTGLKAKSPEIKQKQTKVKDFATMKEENKIPATTATTEHKSAAENINKMIKGISGSNVAASSSNNEDDGTTCDKMQNTTENSFTETRSVKKRNENQVTSSSKMSPIYRKYDEKANSKKSSKSSTKHSKECTPADEINDKSLSTNTGDDLNKTNSLSKFPTIANLNNLSLTTNNKSSTADEYCISGEESDVTSVYGSDSEYSSDDLSSSGEDEMGLKRRHKKKNKDKNFDPKKVVKLDHKRKCYVVDESPKYPLIATPRPLQKRWHYYSESETESEETSDENSSDESCFVECAQSGSEKGKEVRMSTCSNDSGFEGGTAPTSPKKMLETSYTFAQFQRSGRITAPATTIPRFKKYAVDDFHFLTVLGKGSFGKVLLAELRNTEFYYAVKCLKKDVVLEDDDVECTLIERKVLALGTKHPYLCHLFCTFQTESHLFFVMEYLNGGDLMFHIQVSGRFPEPRAKFYAAEIISGLKFLHKKGIIYRDLKLDNILLDFDGHVRIADFGMCKLQIYLDRTADSFCGTPDYMAPEVIKGLKYNQAVDWWSFGVLLYEMLIGQSPFSGCDEDELFWSICNEIPWYPFYLSKDALNILSKLLEKDSNTRMGAPTSPHEDITENIFFNEIDWKKLERRMLEPPFKPQVKHPLDTQYFDRAFTRERVRLTPIDKEILQSMDQQQFQGFTYTNPNATPT
ncbi:uncharacterized protein LOC119068106 isoform X2 [Bradysia coprophila]|uniref:uncharacterized protein LOC119068106 isoform X2 n=1 Tax=Bradysia coprophila TaxID=38358 RepID=UPI00187D9850|nr:uncharacterized protein LOC119068106 isoform X2 [Bradysia coprophila]